MQQSTSFGVGFTLILIGLAVFYWIHSIDPGDNTFPGMLVGSIAICPGAILIGRAIWPPTRDR